MSDDNDKPQLPGGADTLIPMGECDEGHGQHVIALKDGVPVAATHVHTVEDGQPIPDGDVYWVDSRNGRIVDSMRVGKGPAQVSTPVYRNNWEAIFGNRTERGQA
jgi:hypothetical protein